MTPELVPHPLTVRGGTHLTGEQFGELLSCSTETAGPEPTLAEAHLLACEACATELASLREVISLFCEASKAYAEEELRGIPRWKIPRRRLFTHTFVPVNWLTAAAIFLTALLPLQVLHRHAVQTPPAITDSEADRSAQSDEALMDDVNRDLSATVPTSMQALDDPTDDASAADSESSDSTSTQRKD